jgi:hypothetical protein
MPRATRLASLLLFYTATLLATCGCIQLRFGPDAKHRVSYSIDPEFTKDEVAGIYAGIEAWCRAAGGKLLMTEERESTLATIRFERYAYGQLGFLDDGKVVVGKWHSDTHVVDLAPSVVEERLRATVIHELGHAWGLEHSKDDRSFMKSDIGEVKDPLGPIQPIDLKPACKVLGC